MADRDDAITRETAVEMRRHLRVEAALAVSFAIAGDAVRSPGRAVTRDISHGGACIAVPGCTEELLGRFQELPLLELAIDVAPEAAIQGRVEWVRRPAAPGAPALIGLEFRNVSVADEMVIIDLIAHVLIGAGASLPADVSRAGEVRSTLCA